MVSGRRQTSADTRVAVELPPDGPPVIREMVSSTQLTCRGGAVGVHRTGKPFLKRCSRPDELGRNTDEGREASVIS